MMLHVLVQKFDDVMELTFQEIYVLKNNILFRYNNLF